MQERTTWEDTGGVWLFYEIKCIYQLKLCCSSKGIWGLKFKPVSVLKIAPAQVQDLALGLVELQEVGMGPPLKPVHLPLNGICCLEGERTSQCCSPFLCYILYLDSAFHNTENFVPLAWVKWALKDWNDHILTEFWMTIKSLYLQ